MQIRCFVLQYWLARHCDCLEQVTTFALVVVVVVVAAYKVAANVNSKTVDRNDEKCMIEEIIENCFKQCVYIYTMNNSVTFATNGRDRCYQKKYIEKIIQ